MYYVGFALQMSTEQIVGKAPMNFACVNPL